MPTRYALIVAMFLLSVLLYVDRICISTAKAQVAKDLQLTEREMGWVFSAFALGYALFQAPTGMLADRFGARRVLAGVVCFWSLFTAATGLVRGLAVMLVVRFLFGAGEAGAYPGCARAIYSWLPMAERGLAQGFNFSGSRLGAAIAFFAVPWMIQQFGWRETFYVLGGIGVVWAVFWLWWFRDDPAEHPGLSPSERDWILSTRQEAVQAAAPTRPLTAAAVLGSANMWLLMGQYFASNFTFFFCLSWLFPYLKTKYGLSDVETGWYAMLPPLGGMLGHWIAGSLVDALYRGGHWIMSRRVPAAFGFALAAGGVMASLAVNRIELVVACLTIAILGADMTISPSWSACVDIGRRNAGAISGIMNMAGNLGSFVTGLAFPYLTEWAGSPTPFFCIAAALNVCAAIAWMFVRPDRPLEEAP
jgi:ACS family glucarate transporter-like MFS transporter